MYFSIIICTYNPRKDSLLRVLRAVASQEFGEEYEVIIVDNNSTDNTLKSGEIAEYCRQNSNTRILVEKQQGLAYARVAGFENAKGTWLVFVDDDNEVDKYYLANLKQLTMRENETAVWGAGIIDVEFTEGAPLWVQEHFQVHYQKRNFSKTRSGSETGWPDYFPHGSGLSIRADVFDKYATLLKAKAFTITGRKGNTLSSGEDSQMVWTAVKTGFKVGTSPLLKLNHLIPAKRTTLEYLVNLNYNISYSFYKGQYEMFSDKKLLTKPPTIFSKIKLFLKSLKKSRLNINSGMKIFKVENAWFNGFIKLYNEVRDKKI